MTEPQQLTLCEILPPAAKESRRWPGVCVTRDGQHVYTFTRGCRRGKWRWMPTSTSALDRDGYPQIRARLNHRQRQIPIHALVMDAFGKPKPSKAHEIRHLNGNRRDNRIENLAWGTKQDNYNDSVRHGTAAYQRPDFGALVSLGWKKRKERLEAAKMQER